MSSLFCSSLILGVAGEHSDLPMPEETAAVDCVVEELTDNRGRVFFAGHSMNMDAKKDDRIMSLLFANTPSVVGGLHPWEWSQGAHLQRAEYYLDWDQDISDGSLEVMSYTSQKAFAHDKVGPAFRGNARRFHSGRGPFEAHFKNAYEVAYTQNLKNSSLPLCMKVDGEHLSVDQPDCMEICLFKSVAVLRASDHEARDVLDKILDDGGRLLHFGEFAASRGNGEEQQAAAAAAAYAAAVARRGSSVLEETVRTIQERILNSSALASYIVEPDGWQEVRWNKTMPDVPPPALIQRVRGQKSVAERRPPILQAKSPLKKARDEREVRAFVASSRLGVCLGLLTQDRLLQVLAMGIGADALMGDDEVMAQCLYTWCGQVDADNLQANLMLKFEVQKNDHFLVGECDTKFTFEDAAPSVFRRLRGMAGFTEEEYLSSFSCQDAKEINAISTSDDLGLFYITPDNVLVVKTISDKQAWKMIEILPAYENHLRTHPRSLLVRYLGLHRVCPQHDVAAENPDGSYAPRWFVVMASIFHTNLELHEKFDIKGSSRNKRSTEQTRERGLPMKDLDWVDRTAAKGALKLAPLDRAILMKQHYDDTLFLQNLGCVNYSLILGIHDTKNDENRGCELPRYGSYSYIHKPATTSLSVTERLRPKRGLSAALKAASRDKVQSIAAASAPAESTDPASRLTVGQAIPCDDGRELYYIGIADTLTTPDALNSTGIDTQVSGSPLTDPVEYRTRQVEFFRKMCQGISAADARKQVSAACSIIHGVMGA